MMIPNSATAYPPRTFRRSIVHALCAAMAATLALLLPAVVLAQSNELVLYTSVDQPYAQPIAQAFTRQTGIKIRLVTDTEASKSVGLAERLRAEKGHSQADVWWSNEPFHTINLAEEGLLAEYESPSSADIKPMYRDPRHRWAGNGLRARVLAVSEKYPLPTDTIGLAFLQISVLKGKIAMARPTAGTTGGHVAALYTVWGEAKADAFFKALHANEIKLLGGNGPVADAVGTNAALIGLTDNDDCGAALRADAKLKMVIPDQTRDGMGALMLPCTVGLVAGSRNAEQAKKLIDYLLSKEVEQNLIGLQFAGWSVRGEPDVKAMKIDYTAAAKIMPQAVRRATALLEGKPL
jgi:iron(III) transport system substrate-binding protein